MVRLIAFVGFTHVKNLSLRLITPNWQVVVTFPFQILFRIFTSSDGALLTSE